MSRILSTAAALFALVLAPLTALSADLAPCGQYAVSNELKDRATLPPKEQNQKVRIIVEVLVHTANQDSWRAADPVSLRYGEQADQAIPFPPTATCDTTYRVTMGATVSQDLKADFCTIKRIRLLPGPRVQAENDPDGRFCPAAS